MSLQQSIINFENEAQFSFVEKQNILIKPVRKKVFDHIDEQHNYSLILNFDEDEFPAVLHFNETLDITDTVLTSLGIID